jgi:sugar lactone lactonase YvrE
MSPTARRIVASIAVVLIGLCVGLLFWLSRAGAFSSIAPHFAGTCEPISLQSSAADIRVDRSHDIAYLSSLDRQALREGKNVTGTVLRLDLESNPLRAVPALAGVPVDFRPGGMSLYGLPEGTQRLFVLSHPAHAPAAVEIFKREADGQFAHDETLHNPLLVSPHGIVAVGDRQFYVTNNSGARTSFERLTEIAVARSLSTVVYFDGSTMRVVDDAVAQATGIAASADGGRVYVAQAGGRSVRIYSRDSSNGDLTPIEDVKVYSTPENLDVAEDGGIWLAAYPNFVAVLQHRHDPEVRAPSQILRIAPDPLAERRLGEVYLNDGADLSAGSVAAVTSSGFLLGAPLDRKVLVCRLKQ